MYEKTIRLNGKKVTIKYEYYPVIYDKRSRTIECHEYFHIFETIPKISRSVYNRNSDEIEDQLRVYDADDDYIKVQELQF